MKKSIIVILLFLTAHAHASDLQSFLKHCAYGTMIGVGVGVVSLALTDRPSDNTSNIAKGASLGLYGGIGYGIYKLNESPAPAVNPIVDPFAAIAPIFKKGQLDGAQLSISLVSF